MKLRTITAAPLKKGMRVLVRVDFNVVVHKGKILDDFRMREALPTIQFLLRRGCRVRILAHLGRPGGKKVKNLSLAPLARHLSHLLKQRVIFIPDPFSARSHGRFEASRHVLFFENLRFWPGEEKDSASFAHGVSRWGDLYINEAFSDSHRAHASITTLARLLPSFAGYRLTAEVEFLGKALRAPHRPFLFVLGGAKVSTKLPLIRRFLRLADRIVIAGAMANTVFVLRGLEVGTSTVERSRLRSISRSFFTHKKLLYPLDVIVVDSRGGSRRTSQKSVTRILPSDFIGDIGSRSLSRLIREAKRARTIIWNGPLGYVDEKRFQSGTLAFARALSRMHSFRIAGGGETAAMIHKAGLVKKFSHVSTGGGAMLEFLMGKRLPGVQVLEK